ncbi:MAG: M28 family peptidase, partial [Bythopirellula sp.]
MLRGLLPCVYLPCLSLLGIVAAGGEAAEPLLAPFTAEEFQQHVGYLASDELAGRAPGSAGSAQALHYIVERFKEYGLQSLNKDGAWIQEFPLDEPDKKSGTLFAKNAIGHFPGRGTLQDEAVIVCAHYDHIGTRTRPGGAGEDLIYNGADDNASGVASILMMAKALPATRESLPESHRAVIFISFDAEEQGLLGAKHYVQRPLWPLQKTVAVINYDGSGMMRKGKFFASDVETNPILAETVRNAARRKGVIAETRLGGHGRSDHVIFQRLEIPSMHFFTGAHIHYHQVSDETENLNHEGGAIIAWVGYETMRKAITYPGDLEYQELDTTFSIQRAINMIRTLGIIPNVNAQQGRYPEVLFVTPGSAAAKAGLQSGDKIAALNGLRFSRVEDGLLILQQLTFDQGMRIEVLRGEKSEVVTLPAELFDQLSGPKVSPLEDGKHQVLFQYEADAKTKQVALAGEFNDWKPTAHAMEGPNDDGMFTTTLELKPGVYEYKFVVNGTNWVSDPRNLNRVGEYDNSVLSVSAGEKKKSARPGINDRFVDPDLDLSEWLGRFEIESREVYAARQQVLDICAIQPGMTVADVGAGTGFYSRLFASAVGPTGQVYAVDIAPKFLEHIERQASDDDLHNITTVLCDQRDARLPPNAV